VNKIIFVLILVAVIPISANAIPIVYSASGSVNYLTTNAAGDPAYLNFDVHGHITFDDAPTMSYESTSVYWYHYSVLNFDLFTDKDDWAGNIGELLIEVAYGSWFGDLLLPSFGFSTNQVDFLSADGTTLGRLPDSATSLPAEISWFVGDITSTSGSYPQYANMLFTRTSSVPEPTSLALMVLGLAGTFMGSRKKISII